MAPPIKTLTEKYPTWLASNRDKVPAEEFKNYEAQYAGYQKMCTLLVNRSILFWSPFLGVLGFLFVRNFLLFGFLFGWCFWICYQFLYCPSFVFVFIFLLVMLVVHG
jgi:hypothetical protein